VWQANPTLYEEYDRYLFAETDPPPLGLAIQRATELIGTTVDPRQPDDRTNQVIRRAISAYESVKIKQIPNLLLPYAAITGAVKSVGELQAILARELKP
jgi:hypothetical protein